MAYQFWVVPQTAKQIWFLPLGFAPSQRRLIYRRPEAEVRLCGRKARSVLRPGQSIRSGDWLPDLLRCRRGSTRRTGCGLSIEIRLELLRTSVHRPVARFILKENPGQTVGNFLRDLEQVHQLARAGRTLDFEIVAVIKIER